MNPSDSKSFIFQVFCSPFLSLFHFLESMNVVKTLICHYFAFFQDIGSRSNLFFFAV